MKTHAIITQAQALSQKSMAFMLLLALTFTLSCNRDEDLGAHKEDSEAVQLSALEDLYQEDTEDLAIEVLESNELETGRSFQDDSRLACAIVTRTGDKTAGTISIDFGDSCTDERGNVRKGLIVIEYQGRWTLPGSSWSLSFADYFMNEVAIQGTRVITNISASEQGTQVFTIVLEAGSMTWPDGSIARRTVHRTRELERDHNNILNRLIIYGTAEGNLRNGRGYQIEILERLIYDRACADEGVIIPVSGIKLIKHGQREITVDYGDGTCDNTVTITNKDGRTWTYTVDPH